MPANSSQYSIQSVERWSERCLCRFWCLELFNRGLVLGSPASHTHCSSTYHLRIVHNQSFSPYAVLILLHGQTDFHVCSLVSNHRPVVKAIVAGCNLFLHSILLGVPSGICLDASMKASSLFVVPVSQELGSRFQSTHTRASNGRRFAMTGL